MVGQTGSELKIYPGNRYGKWTVVYEYDRHYGYTGKNRKWVCECECGTFRSVFGNHLASGKSKSCGCIQAKPEAEVRLNTIYNWYKTRARGRSFAFTLSKDEFEILIDMPCVYCGETQTSHQKKNGQSDVTFYYTGIDRVDSSKGYISGNTVSCCKICNTAKSDLPVEQFQEHFSHLQPEYY